MLQTVTKRLHDPNFWRGVRLVADVAQALAEVAELNRKRAVVSGWERDLRSWEAELAERNADFNNGVLLPEERRLAAKEEELLALARSLEEREGILLQKQASLSSDGYTVLSVEEGRAWDWVQRTLPGLVGYAGRPGLEGPAKP